MRQASKQSVRGQCVCPSQLYILDIRTVIAGTRLPGHFWGVYAQVFEGTDNTMKERTVGAIALGPTGNL
jgi:hypothetical protein